jgi:uncharacterized membrane protein (DUF4010 family)
MENADLFMRLGLALAIGLLLGLERGWNARQQSEGGRIAGIRTFALTGLLGGLSGWLAGLTTPLFPAAAVLVLGALLVAGYWLSTRQHDDLGLTTEVALLLAFALGMTAVLGEMATASAAAVVTALLLSMKSTLHGWVEHIERFELDALLRLALISVVILPILPNRGFGPGQVLNPYALWWAVVIVAALSFVGYVAVRLAGPRIGVLATGLFGGVASSTATTLALARKVQGHDALAPVAAAGIVAAGSVSFLRILALVAVFGPTLLAPLALPMGVMAASGFAGAALVHGRGARSAGGAGKIDDMRNPLELTTALAFGVVLAVVLLAVHFLEAWLGARGVYAAAALSGLTDVDALTISVSRLAGQDLPASSAALAIFIAASVNTAVKGAMSLVVGGRALGVRVIAVYAAVILAGGVAFWLGLLPGE